MKKWKEACNIIEEQKKTDHKDSLGVEVSE